MTDKDFSPSLSHPQSAVTGFEPMLGTLPFRRQLTLLRRLRGFINRLGRWQQPTLLQLLDDPNPKLRERAVRNLRVIGDSCAVPRLLRLLGEEKIDTIRLHAIWALSGISDQQAGPARRFRLCRFSPANVKFPERTPALLGFTQEQLKTGLLAGMVGNSYAGSSLLGLTAILDEAKPGNRIFFVSFGSGAGSDAMVLRTDRITERQDLAPKTRDYIARRTEIDYALYVRYRGKLQTK